MYQAIHPATAAPELVKEAQKENRPDPGTLGGQGCASAVNTELREVKSVADAS